MILIYILLYAEYFSNSYTGTKRNIVKAGWNVEFMPKYLRAFHIILTRPTIFAIPCVIQLSLE